MTARTRLWPAVLSVAYVCFAAAQARPRGLAWVGLVLLPVGLFQFWRITPPGDKRPAPMSAGLRALAWGIALFIAARLGPPGRAALDAAANFGIGVAAVACLVLMARVEGPGGLLSPPKVAKSRESKRSWLLSPPKGAASLDAAILCGFMWAVATALPAAYALLPAERVLLDPLAIDYATTSAGVGSLMVLITAAFRMRSLRRLELGVGDRAAGALALALTAFFIAVPAAALDVAAPDRLLPISVALASALSAWAVTTPEPTLVSAALRGIVAVMVLGTPIVLSAGVAARALPEHSGAIVLASATLAVAAGVVARAVARPLGPEQSRWLDALEQASRGALQPEPDEALRAALSALAKASKDPLHGPEIWRHHPDQRLRVDIAGYLHVEPAEAPPRLYELGLAEPERTLRAEVLRAVEVRRPDVRGLLAWFDARQAFSATVIADDDGPVGFILMPRSGRTAPLTLEEARAARALGDRITALLQVSSALERARERELVAEARAERALAEVEKLNATIVGQGEQHRARAERLATGLRRTAYSPAARSTLDELSRLARTSTDVMLVTPHGVDPVPWGAHAHLEGARSGGPFVVVDATQPAERDPARWLDAERSPLVAARGGTLLVLEPSALPTGARDELLRGLARKEGENPALARPVLITASPFTATELAAKNILPTWVTERLRGAEVRLPELVERAEDLRALILDHLARYSLRLGREPLGIEPLALRWLIEHRWPTNELELGAVLARAALAAEGPTVGVAELEAIGFSPDPVPMPEPSPIPAVLSRRGARRFPRG